MAQNSNQLFVVFFLIILGFLIGAVLATWMANRDAANKAKKNVLPRQEPERKSILNPKEYEEVVGLWRNRTDGRLVVLRGRDTIEKSTQLGDEHRKKMEQAARDWLVWLGLLPPRAAQPSPSGTPVEPKPEPSHPSVIYAPAPPEIPIPKPNILDSVAQALAPNPSDIKNSTSIVRQINDILQDNLRGSELATRGIRLSEDALQGVIVHVGLERFVGIDAVTEPEIKTVIKAAVAEWEHRTGAGK